LSNQARTLNREMLLSNSRVAVSCCCKVPLNTRKTLNFARKIMIILGKIWLGCSWDAVTSDILF